MFITFEGIEGSGKTTQITHLKEWLVSQGKEVVVTREPGGTDFGRMLREIILSPESQFLDVHTELLLFFSDRLEHIAAVIKPALASGKVVICDRYVDSTWAYQVGGRGISDTIVQSLNQLVSVTPDRTILLDLDPLEGLRRAKTRDALDRFEQEEISFHQRIRAMYLHLAQQYPDRIHTVSVQGKSVEDLFSEISQVFI